jgi:hypothetical protein
MERKMLRGIKERAERLASGTSDPRCAPFGTESPAESSAT